MKAEGKGKKRQEEAALATVAASAASETAAFPLLLLLASQLCTEVVLFDGVFAIAVFPRAPCGEVLVLNKKILPACQ